MIGCIGLGKLGYPLAALLGHQEKTIGVDLIEDPPHPEEPNFERLLRTSDLHITTDFSELRGCHTVFCLVPTPSMKNGKFTNKYIRDAITKASPYLDKCEIFNIVSTVMPGSCERLQKMLPQNTAITYNPEFVAIGDIINGMMHPDFVLIGAEDRIAASKLELICQNITKSPVKVMDLKSAELAKITLNSYITMKITFANVLGEMAQEIGANPRAVLDAIGTDSRIGKKYLSPGAPYGGPCFPRDNRAFAQISKVKGYSELTDELNEGQVTRWVKIIEKELNGLKGKNVAIIGTSYKSGISFSGESAGLKIAASVRKAGAKVTLDDITIKTELIVYALPGERPAREYARRQGIKVVDCWK